MSSAIVNPASSSASGLPRPLSVSSDRRLLTAFCRPWVPCKQVHGSVVACSSHVSTLTNLGRHSFKQSWDAATILPCRRYDSRRQQSSAESVYIACFQLHSEQTQVRLGHTGCRDMRLANSTKLWSSSGHTLHSPLTLDPATGYCTRSQGACSSLVDDLCTLVVIPP